MGYNNHHAGMHYKRWSGVYGTFDDGREIDRAAMMKKPLKTYQNKDMYQTKKDSLDEYRNRINENTIYRDKENDIRQVTIENLIDMELVAQNIIYLSLKQRIDVLHILNKCELIMENSEYLKGMKLNVNETIIVYHPKCDEIFLFLSLVAQELNVKIYELFIDNTFAIADFVCEILKEIPNDDWGLSWLDDMDLDNEELVIPCDCYIPLGIKFQKYKDEKSSENNRVLYLSREKTEYGFLYSIHFGFQSMAPQNRYVQPGAYLWREFEGDLCDYIERLINVYKKSRSSSNNRY